MVRDFGGADLPRWRRGERLAFARSLGGKLFLLVCLVLIGSLPMAMPVSIDEMNGTTGPPSNPVGKPCPSITEAMFNRGWSDPPHVFSFAGATFARRRGDADCSSGKHGLLGVVGPIYPVCQFDAPFQLAVTRQGRTRYFAVPAGHTAVVEAAPDQTLCKVTRRYDLYALSGGA